MANSQVTDQQWIKRCFELAKQGLGYVSPNPPVGAVLVHDEKIISEGFHPYYGGDHAEVVTLQHVKEEDRHLIPQSILYVSLEPCCIHGKTPPCTELIVREQIKDVRFSTLDPNPAVAGKSVEILRAKGVNVTTGILEEEGNYLIRSFRKNILYHQPFVVLKWAQSQFGFLGDTKKRILLSHPHTATWTHGLRAEADAILIGARTVMIDNPMLTTRDYPGRSPHRVIYDPNGSLNEGYHVFANDGQHIFYFAMQPNEKLKVEHITFIKLDVETSHAKQIVEQLHAYRIGILLVEGGAHLLGMFISENVWDEAWVIRTRHPLRNGINAPVIKGKLISEMHSLTDTITGVENVERKT